MGCTSSMQVGRVVPHTDSIYRIDSEVLFNSSFTSSLASAKRRKATIDSIPDVLASYVSKDLLLSLRKEPLVFDKPKREVMKGCLLFVDISGFTPLTEKLAREGEAGAEKLMKHINKAFSPIIDTITKYSGSIERFAGDAIINIFRAQNDSYEAMTTQTLIAVQCGLEILSKYSLYKSEVDGITLQIHIAVAAGDLTILYVGGGGKGAWRRVITGQPFEHIGNVIDGSDAGQLVIDCIAHSYIRPRVKSQMLEDGNFLIEEVHKPATVPVIKPIQINQETETVIRTFIEPSIQVLIDAGQTNWFAQVRHITVVFLNLKGVDLFQEDQDHHPDMSFRGKNRVYDEGLNMLHNVVQKTQEIIYQFDGSIANCLVDDKGTSVLACFGFPVSHPDDPLRAIKAAKNIQAAVTGFGLTCSMGITSGDSWCGSMGNRLRQEATVMGDSVNLAARLMAQSERQIYCDESVKQATCADVTYYGEREVRLKGKEGTFKLYVPGTIKHKTDSHDRIRNQSVQYIKNGNTYDVIAWSIRDLASRRASSYIIVEGQTGFGKTHLLEEVKKIVSGHEGLACFCGLAYESERNNQFAVWAPVFQQLVLKHFHVIQRRKHDKAEHKLSTKLLLEGSEEISDLSQSFDFIRDQMTESDVIQNALTQVLKSHEKPYIPLLSRIFNFATTGDLPDELSTDEQTSVINRLLIKILSRVKRMWDMQLERHSKTVSADKTGENNEVEKHRLDQPAKALVITLDNLHWFDPDSIQLLHNILLDKNLMDSILIIATVTPILNPTGTMESVMSMTEQKLVLQTFNTENTCKLIYSILERTNSIDETLLTIIMKKSQGNPFLIVEILAFLQNNESITITGGRCQLQEQLRKNIDQLKIPETVSATLYSVIDRLYPTEQLILKVASVIGMKFDTEVLRTVFPIEVQRDSIEDNLRELAKFGLITLISEEKIETRKTRERHSFNVTNYMKNSFRTRRSFDGTKPQRNNITMYMDQSTIKTYKFKNRELQEMCYKLLLKQASEDIHWSIAECLVKQIAHQRKNRNENIESIARHMTKFVESRSERTEHEINMALYYLHQTFHPKSVDAPKNIPVKRTGNLKNIMKALELVKLLPDTPIRARKEVQLLLTYIEALHSVGQSGLGSLEEKQLIEKCFVLCSRFDKLYFRVLWYHWFHHYCASTAAYLPEMPLIPQALIDIARNNQDSPDMAMIAYLAVLKESERAGMNGYNLVDFVERGLDIYCQFTDDDIEKFGFKYGQMDYGVHFLCHGLRVCWMMGKNLLFLSYVTKGLTMLRRVNHHPSCLHFLANCCCLLYYRREFRLMHNIATEMDIVAKKYGIVHMRDLAHFFLNIVEIQEAFNSDAPLSTTTYLNKTISKLENFYLNIDIPVARITESIAEITITSATPLINSNKTMSPSNTRVNFSAPFVSEEEDDVREEEDMYEPPETQSFVRMNTSASLQPDYSFVSHLPTDNYRRLRYICCTSAYTQEREKGVKKRLNSLIETITCPQQNTCNLTMLLIDSMIDIGEDLEQAKELIDQMKQDCKCNRNVFNLDLNYLQAKLEIKQLLSSASVPERLLENIETSLKEVIDRAVMSLNQSLQIKALIQYSLLLLKQKEYYQIMQLLHPFSQDRITEGDTEDLLDLKFLYEEACKYITETAKQIVPNLKA